VLFRSLLVDNERRLRIDTSDEIIKGALLTHDGAVVNPILIPQPAETGAARLSG
jgi:hypothetical protein